MALNEIKQQLFNVDLDPKSFFDVSYWTDTDPGMNFEYLYHIYLLSFLLLITGLFFGVYKIFFSKDIILPVKKFYSKTATYLYLLSAYGFLYGFFRTQGIQVLSTRILLLVWLILVLVFVLYTIYYKSKKLPEDINKYWSHKTRQKYMPKKKKKKRRK